MFETNIEMFEMNKIRTRLNRKFTRPRAREAGRPAARAAPDQARPPDFLRWTVTERAIFALFLRCGRLLQWMTWFLPGSGLLFAVRPSQLFVKAFFCE